MSKISQYDAEKLLDDMKIIGKSCKVMSDENDQIKRAYALGLIQDLVDRMYRDIQEMRDAKEKNAKTYGGTISRSKRSKKTTKGTR